jgi:transposase
MSNEGMKALYVRALTDEEQTHLRQSLKSSEGFQVRRAQMILMSAEERLKVNEIGRRLGCQGQTVREAIHAFEQSGVKCLEVGSRARHDDQRAFGDAARERLLQLMRRSPRELGYESSLWSLELVAQASFEHGLTATHVSGETVRATLAAMGIQWKRAKHWINSPDPHYEAKKTTRLAEAASQLTP